MQTFSLQAILTDLCENKRFHMENIKSELEEYIATGYDYDAAVNIGNGWEPYHGCAQNLLMILEDPDTEVKIVAEDSILYQLGVRRYLITLPAWWRQGVISLSFEEVHL